MRKITVILAFITWMVINFAAIFLIGHIIATGVLIITMTAGCLWIGLKYPVTAKIYCIKCGIELLPGTVYCPKCGTTQPIPETRC